MKEKHTHTHTHTRTHTNKDRKEQSGEASYSERVEVNDSAVSCN